jgi:protein-tyrosine phosphatase
MVSEADLILVMETGQARSMRDHYPHSRGKLFLLGQFGQEVDYEIQDPYGGTPEMFARCYGQIRQACEQLLPFLIHVR